MQFIIEQSQRAYAAFARLALRFVPASARTNAAPLIRRARLATAKSAFREAALSYRAALEFDPNNLEAIAGLGKCLSRLGEWTAAAAVARRFAELAPGRASAKRLLGRALYQTKDLEGAERVFGELLTSDASDQDARLFLARIALRRSRPEEALSHLELLRPRGAVILQRHLLRGDALLQMSRPAEAVAAYEAAWRLDPGRIETLRRLADAYGRIGSASDAERVLRQLSRARPSDAQIALRLARVLLEREAFDEAEALVHKSLARLPNDREALKIWAKILDGGRWQRAAAPPGTAPPPRYREGSRGWIEEQLAAAIYAFRTNAFAEAVAAVERILAHDEKHAMALEIGGYAANRAADWAAAARFWRALGALQENRRGPRLQLVTALTEGGDAAAALVVIDPLLAEDPLSHELIRSKFAALTRLRDPSLLESFDEELGRRSWTEADAPLLETIGSGFLSAGSPAAARRWLERARTLDPANATALRLQARIAYSEREYASAILLCEELERVGSEPQKTEARLIQARIAHLCGKPAEATLHYERVVAGAPDNTEAVTFLVRRHLSQRQIEKAEELMRNVPRAGNEGTHQWWKALVLQAKGDTDGACDGLFKTLEGFAADTQYRLRVAEFLMELSRFQDASQVIERGLEIDAKSLRLRTRLLQCRIAMECLPEEIVAISSATLAIDPGDEEALLQRGNAFTRLGRRREAIADFRSGIALFPRNTTFWRSTVSSLLLLGEEVPARELLEEAKAVFAEESAANFAALAEIFDAADLSDEALRYAEEATRRDPEAIASRQLLARIEVGRGGFDRAWPHLLSLQGSEQRHIRTTRLYAQAAAGRWALREWAPGEISGEARPFPDALFDAIVGREASRAGAPPAEDAAEQPLRILHVTSTLGPGGAERQLANTLLRMARLRNAGIEVELAVEDLNPAHGRDFFLPVIRESDIRVTSLDEERQAGNWRDMLAERPQMRGAVQAIASMPPEIVKNALPLLPILLERRPQVVHLWQDSVCIASGIAAVLAGVPRIVLGTRSTRPVERQRSRRYLEPGFRALLARPGVSLINNSKNGARDYEDWLEMPEGSVTVIHNGFDFTAMRGRTEEDESRRIRRELGIPCDAPVLGGVMRCSFEKRPELWTEAAIDVMGRMPEAHAILVGEGPMLGQITARAAEEGLLGRIHFVANQSPVEPWMRAMSLLFLSSLTEGLPNVLIEAQALGVPVATMRIGGAPETVREGETAIVIDEGPIAAIGGAISLFLADRERREAFGESAARWAVQQFGIDATVEKLLDFYRFHGGVAPVAEANEGHQGPATEPPDRIQREVLSG